MKVLRIFLLVAACVWALAMVPGCGDKSYTDSQTEGDKTVTARDCDGGCGMKDVPTDQLTEIHGKYYCAGCKDKAEEGDHSGHDHG